MQAGVRTKAGTKESLLQALHDFEALLPEVVPNLEALSAAKWVRCHAPHAMGLGASTPPATEYSRVQSA